METLDPRLVLTGSPMMLAADSALEQHVDLQPELTTLQAEGEGTMETSRLTVFANGQRLDIPANIGVNSDSSTADVFTNAADGGLQRMAGTSATLGDFFDVWRTNAGLAGNNADAVLSATQLFTNTADTSNTVKMFVNGQISDEFGSHTLQNGEEIILVYGDDPVVSLNTNFGSIVIELFETETPGTVNNFLNYVNDGDYINSFFHRSADSGGNDFVIQGGGFTTNSTTFTSTAQFTNVPTDAPIQNEPGISNVRGTVAMAKTSDPDSATSQFFVNLHDNNTFLDSASNSGGFTAFGQVLDLTSSDEIAAFPVNTSNAAPFGELPLGNTDQLVVVQSIVGRGEISGVHFNDTDQDGSLDPGETGISGATVYLDANDNGTLDPGEVSTATDSNGRYLFQVDPGTYEVRAIFDNSLNLTVPASADGYTVTVEIGREADGRDFGVAVIDNTPATQVDAYSVNEDSVLTVTAANGVLSNDTSRTSSALIASPNTQPANGSLTLNSDGSLTYTPDSNFFGTDTFTYIASDGTNLSNATAVTVTVNAQPDAPLAVADTLTLSNSRSAQTVTLLDNDSTAPDGTQTLTVTAVTQGSSGGTVTLDNGVVSYLAPEGFTGTDTFTYTIQDTDGLTSSATATVNVTEIANNSLSGFVYIDANKDGVRDTGESGVPGAQITLTGAGLTQSILTDSNGAYSFVDLPAGTYQLVERQPVAMIDGTDSTTVPNAVVGDDQITTISLDGGQDFAENNFGEMGIQSKYVSIAWFFASFDSLKAMFRETIAISEEMDGDASLVATIRAGGTEVPDGTNAAPIATPDTYSVDENTMLSIAESVGVLQNDTDTDGDSMTAVIVTQTTNGTLSLSGDGSFTYTPNSNFFGTDTFTYRASDGTDLSNTATVTITVNEVASANTFTLAENSAAGTVVGQVTSEVNLGNDPIFTFDDSTLTPELEFAADDHITGDPAGAVVLIEYVDFQCPVCRTYHPIVEQLEQNFPDDLVVVTRHLPLTTVHPNAFGAAVAAEAAGRQGQFDAFGDLLFDNQDDWDGASDPQSFFETYATQLGLDLTQFRTDQADQALADRVTRDSNAANTLGASSTPTFFLNGQQIANPSTASQAPFDAVIQAEVDQIDDVFRLNRQTGEITVADRTALDFETTPNFSLVVNGVGLDGTTSQTNVRVRLTNVNDIAPVAVADSYSVNENSALVINASLGVLSNDSDAEGDSLTAQQVAAPSNGTVSLSADGSFTYTPSNNFDGTDTFTYRATDGSLNSATTTVTITVANTSTSAPVTAVDSYTLDEDSSLTVTAANGVLDNDSDPDGASLTAALGTAPQNGTASLNSDGSFTYTPNANFSGTDAFTYTANDGTETSGATSVTLTVNPLGDTPTGAADSYSVEQGGILNVSAANGLLSNDNDVDGDTITAVLFSNPSEGILTFNADGSFIYDSDDTFVGTDSFTYRVSDGTFESTSVTVTITVTDVNIAPVAAADSFSVDEDTTLAVDAASGLLNNDTDADGDALTINVTGNVTNGVLTVQNDGSLTYTPDANFNGTDTFTYRLNDGITDSNAAVVSITVNGTNDSPISQVDTYSVPVDGALTVDAANGILANDSDVDGDSLTATLGTTTSNGTLALQSDGSFTYSPNSGVHATDMFTYTTSDGTTQSTETTVTIHINTVASPAADSYSVDEDATLSINAAAGVLNNDSDVDGDSLTATIAVAPSNGTVTLNSDGSFSYQGNADFNGTDTFTYTANDGFANSAPAVVSITVNAVNDSPVANDEALKTDVGQTLVVSAASGVLANDSDVDGDSITATLQTSPSNGTIALSGDGSFTFTPNANFKGTDTFTYVANDGTVDSNAATVTIAVNSAAIAVDDTYVVDEDTTLTVAVGNGVLNNDNSVDGDSLTATVVSQPTNGQLTLNGDGSFDYTPNSDFTGTDSFAYVANDGTADSTAAIVTITVNAINDGPVALADDYTVAGESSLTVTAGTGVLSNDSDAEGETLSAVLIGGDGNGDGNGDGVANGSLTFNSDGSFTYTPNSGFAATDTFTYHATDGNSNSATRTVTITVSPADLLRVRLEAAATDGTPIDTIAAGESFIVNAFVEDIRSTPRGVFAAYVDVIYDSSLATAGSTINFAATYPSGRAGTTSTPGLVDEVGAFSQAPPNNGEELMFTIPFVANAAGTLDINLDPADLSPAHDMLLLGINNAISLDLVDFVSDTLTITAAAGAEGEGGSQAEYQAGADAAFAAEENWLLN